MDVLSCLLGECDTDTTIPLALAFNLGDPDVSDLTGTRNMRAATGL